MEVRSILVNIDIGNPGSPSLIYAVDLAQTLGAELIGLVADQPNLAYLGVDAGGAAVEFYTAQREVIKRQFARAEAAFRAAAPASVKAQWCAYVATQTEALLGCAAAADLIVTPSRVTNAFGESQKVALGELVLGAGRPVLDVGATASKAGQNGSLRICATNSAGTPTPSVMNSATASPWRAANRLASSTEPPRGTVTRAEPSARSRST